jgi:hypothetical protein
MQCRAIAETGRPGARILHLAVVNGNYGVVGGCRRRWESDEMLPSLGLSKFSKAHFERRRREQ